MVKKVAKRFYDSLTAGTILAAQCNDCGNWTFPPVTACRECGSRNIEMKEISGEGTVYFYSTSILPPKKFAEYSPYAYGLVELKEGPAFMTMIEGLDASTPEKIAEGNKRLPLPVKAEVIERAGMNVVCFKISE
ncbi:MAG: Zn-ribbon domain-containing OB-fold protein [Promethearchaeota archaeon]